MQGIVHLLVVIIAFWYTHTYISIYISILFQKPVYETSKITTKMKIGCTVGINWIPCGAEFYGF